MAPSSLAFFSPYGRIGSTVNVVVSGGSALFLTIWGITHGAPQFFLVAAVFAGMCVFGFVPVMRKAYAAKRATPAANVDMPPQDDDATQDH
ncbi:hypothetical protein [Microbacterium sp. ZW T5_56]|uniref:hypothetical protein n=1 Tax=Microbacterium sp. ZW T5_56 TaxID=3378081 RepID=UPI003854600C